MSSILERAAVSLAESQDSNQPENLQSRRSFLGKAARLAGAGLGAIGLTVATQAAASANFTLRISGNGVACRYGPGTQYAAVPNKYTNCGDYVEFTSSHYGGYVGDLGCGPGNNKWHRTAVSGCYISDQLTRYPYQYTCCAP